MLLSDRPGASGKALPATTVDASPATSIRPIAGAKDIQEVITRDLVVCRNGEAGSFQIACEGSFVRLSGR